MSVDLRLVEPADAPPDAPPSKRRSRAAILKTRVWEAYGALLEHTASGSQISGLADALHSATVAECWYWKSRANRTETQIRRLLASDALDPSQRQTLVAALNRSGGSSDANLLSADETDLLKQYRTLSAVGRQAVRQIVTWASANAGCQAIKRGEPS